MMTFSGVAGWFRLRRWLEFVGVAAGLLAAIQIVVLSQPAPPARAGSAVAGKAFESVGGPGATQHFTAAITSDITGLDPALAVDANSLLVTAQIYDTLVRYAPDDMAPMPGLAASWSVSQDHLEWTFSLRSGVRFHDGASVDAAAVVYNLQRWWDPAHPAHNGDFDYFRFVFGGFKGDPNCLITGIGAVGTSQVKIILRQPANVLPTLLAFPALAIASPAAIQGGALASQPVGSGSFRFVSRTVGESVLLEANPDAVDRHPLIGALTFQVITTPSARLAALRDGAVLSANEVDAGDSFRNDLDPLIELQWRTPLSIGYLGLNRAHAPLDKLLVRQAIAHAIDRRRLVAATYPVGSQAARTLLPPTIWGDDPAIADYEYDPALAQSLIAQAGISTPITIPLGIRDVYRPYMPAAINVANGIQSDLAAVGIIAPVTLYPSGEFVGKAYAGELDMFLLGWGADYPHPANFYGGILCGSNLAFGPLDQDLCSRLDAAAMAPDFAAELEIYNGVSKKVHETLPLLPISFGQATNLATHWPADGLRVSSLAIEDYSSVFFATAYTYMPAVLRQPPGTKQ